MTPEQIEEAASRLFEAERTGTQCGLLSLAYPDMTLDDAYAVQSALVAKKRAAGTGVIGWKIGLTSRAMQQALNITTPDSGVLLDDMLFANSAAIPAGRFIQPRVEAEIAFIMKSDLAGADVTRDNVLAATAHVAPSLEILDTRILRADPETGKARTITDTISDNAANAGIVLGKERHAIDAFDLRWVGAIVKRDGVVEETGLGAGVLNDPVTGILWLVHRLARYGDGLSAGDIVLSGSFIRPIEAPSGSAFRSRFRQFRNRSPSHSAKDFPMPAPVNTLKHRLQAGETLVGCWLGMAEPYLAEISATAGFDWLLIDGEHAPNDIRSMAAQLAVLEASGASTVVRLPDDDPAKIKQVLDIGAQNILVPMVESAAQAAASTARCATRRSASAASARRSPAPRNFPPSRTT
jgi:2-oxo-hept-3-ene-1,7-dioate hydratase